MVCLNSQRLSPTHGLSHGIANVIVQETATSFFRDKRVGAQDSDFKVKLSLWSFVLMWITIAMIHVLCMCCFGIQSWVYRQLPMTSLSHSLELYGVTMAPSNFRVVAYVYATVTLIHGVLLLEMLLGSIWHQHLRFEITTKTQKRRLTHNRRDRSPKALFYHIFHLVFGERGIFGVKGRYFEAIYVVREIFESVLQSTQAYRMSEFVPRLLVNRFFVFTIVINCWSTPVINYVFANNPPLQRMLCLMFDIALDFTSTVGVPVVLSIPYVKQYDFKTANFSRLLYRNDIWFVNMINQLRIVFISSWMDLLSEITFLVSLIISLQDVKNLLHSYPKCLIKPSKTNRIHITIEPNVHSVLDNVELNNIEKKSMQLRQNRSIKSSGYQIIQVEKQKEHAIQRNPKAGSLFVKIAHMIMIFWGTLHLMVHFHASFQSNSTHCAQRTWPWLGTKSGCMFLRINCNNSAQHTGSFNEIESILAKLNEQALSYIAIRNCPHIEIPPCIQRFPNLVGVKIYNSTLASWDADAALTTKHHPKIVFLFVIKTNMTQIPLGLLAPDFPPKIRDIEFGWTNLTAIPDNLSEIWPKNGFIMFERSPIDSVPAAFLLKPMHQVSISGNEITQLTSEVFSSPLASSMWFNGNSISVLPEALVPSKAITYLDLSNTMVRSLPSWVDKKFLLQATIVAGGTPLCDRLKLIIQSGSNTAVTEDLTTVWAGLQTGHLKCSTSGSYFYLYDMEAQQ